LHYIPAVSGVQVHLVRHGDVENPQRLRYGRLPGFPLSYNGRAQAQRAAEFLASSQPRIGAVFSGPLERARETADVIATHLGTGEVVVDPRLTEAASRFDGLPRAFAALSYMRRHLSTIFSSAHETPSSVARRMREAVLDRAREAREHDQHAIVLVSHQIPIQYVRRVFERGGLDVRDAAAWLRFQLGFIPTAPCTHASITTLRIDDRDRLVDVMYVEP
jgi:broad specificity phosphatase PhoE